MKVLDIKEIIAYWENYAEELALIIEDSYDNYFEDLGTRLSVCEATLDILRQLDC